MLGFAFHGVAAILSRILSSNKPCHLLSQTQTLNPRVVLGFLGEGAEQGTGRFL